MKGWNEYFKKEEHVNEDHKKTKDEQVAWVCETMQKLSEEEVKKVYDFIEDNLGVD